MTPLRFGSAHSATVSRRASVLADRLVAEVEEVGVEEREVVVGRVRSGHVRADGAAVALRVVLVLDAQRRPERSDGEARHVAGGEDVVAPADAAAVVDDDPVVEREPGPRRELLVRDDPEPGDDRVRLERRAAPRA